MFSFSTYKPLRVNLKPVMSFEYHLKSQLLVKTHYIDTRSLESCLSHHEVHVFVLGSTP